MRDTVNSSELIQRGQAAALVGRQEEARQHLLRAVELDPQNVEAWLLLAGVEQDPLRKAACFDTILEIDPDHPQARLGLDLLRQSSARNESAPSEEDDELEAVIAKASRQLDQVVGPPAQKQTPLDDGPLYCANHPNVETMLRCNRCGKPICTRCAVQTPVGYRCKECVGRQQAIFYSGGALDYVIGAVLGLILGGIAAYLMALLGFWFFSLLLGPTIGIAIAELVRMAVRRRRSRYLWLAVGGGMVVGALPSLFLAFGSLWALLALGLFLVLGIGAATARLR